jgi:diguanylate cyclase (GGDEF)-like protein
MSHGLTHVPRNAAKDKKPGEGVLAKRIGAFAGVMMLLNTGLVLIWWLTVQRADMRADAEAIASAVGQSISEKVHRGETLENSIPAEQPVAQAWLTSPTSLELYLLASQGEVRLMDELSDQAMGRGKPVSRLSGSTLSIAVPFELANGTPAAVRLEWDAGSHTSAFMKEIGFASLLATLFALLSIALIGARVKSFLLPLDQIVKFARELVQSKASARLDINTSDEFQTLGQALNQVVRQMDGSMDSLRKLAFTDQATGLANGERFKQELELLLANRDTHLHPPSILHLSLDGLPQLVSSLGREAGEEVVSIIAERLTAGARVADRVLRLSSVEAYPTLVARLSPLEFALFLPEIEGSEPAVLRYAQMIAAALAQPLEWRSHRLILGAHCGGVVCNAAGASVSDLLKQADLAMHSARDEGVVCRFYSPSMETAVVERMRLEDDLRAAIANGEIVAWFQPKLNLHSGELESAEALARWVKPSGEIVSPAIFIPLAEEIGLIGEIGDAIMRDACMRTVEWRRQGVELRMAVNVSTHQFTNDRFAAKVFKVLDDTQMPTHLLEIEVTESAAMSDTAQVLEIIEPLRAKGIRFAIDDFGTGHSSLSVLTKLPFDTFKIDQQFVRDLDTDPSAPTLIETILAMAAALNYETVAEGVETEDQAEFLRRRGATLGQGYLFSKPLPADKFLDYALDLQAKHANRAAPEPGGVISA